MPRNPVLRLSNSNQSLNNNLADETLNPTDLLNKNYNALIRERLAKEYPGKYAVCHAISVSFFGACMIVAERMQPDNFTWADFFVISYRTLDGIILLSAGVNIFYALLALFTGI